ncbi:MAG: hypothetical protein RLN62_02935 [Rickettsiales bacterium]
MSGGALEGTLLARRFGAEASLEVETSLVKSSLNPEQYSVRPGDSKKNSQKFSEALEEEPEEEIDDDESEVERDLPSTDRREAYFEEGYELDEGGAAELTEDIRITPPLDDLRVDSDMLRRAVELIEESREHRGMRVSTDEAAVLSVDWSPLEPEGGPAEVRPYDVFDDMPPGPITRLINRVGVFFQEVIEIFDVGGVALGEITPSDETE